MFRPALSISPVSRVLARSVESAPGGGPDRRRDRPTRDTASRSRTRPVCRLSIIAVAGMRRLWAATAAGALAVVLPLCAGRDPLVAAEPWVPNGGASSRFVDARPFSEGLAPVQWDDAKARRWGYIDTRGGVVIAARFLDAGRFQEGLAAVRFDGHGASGWGYIDHRGQVAIPPRFAAAGPFQNGLAVVEEAGDPGRSLSLIDRSGQVLLRSVSQGSRDCSSAVPSHRAAAAEAPPPALPAADQAPGLATNGAPICATPHFAEGLAPVYVPEASGDGGAWGFIDQTGRLVIGPRFDAVGWFSEGLADVMLLVDGRPRWGYVDRHGALAIAPVFDGAYRFSEGLAAFREGVGPGARWGFVDTTGRVVIAPQFLGGYSVGPHFSEGLAAVRRDDGQGLGDWVFIDRSGKVVIGSRHARTGPRPSSLDGLASWRGVEAVRRE